ncbi:peptidylprolyl isomerase [Thermoleophilia bacterium SCSIO 60948]|nr:peptidylprolyl isomerase [Thermoleophilia bacterium SCSIO 60948]
MSSRRLPILIAFVVLLAAAVAVVLLTRDDEQGGGEPTGAYPEGCEPVAESDLPGPQEFSLSAPKGPPPSGPLQATITTNCGEMVADLDTENFPETAASFAYQAEEGVYDDNVIFRVEPDFVFQTGSPTQDATGDAGYSISEKVPAGTEYLRGTVAMGKSAIDPAGGSSSQYFIVTAPADAGLPPDYAVVGQVREEDFDVLDRINELAGTPDPATGQSEPQEPLVVSSVEISAEG